jgi:hypothetical protein
VLGQAQVAGTGVEGTAVATTKYVLTPFCYQGMLTSRWIVGQALLF